MRRKCSVMFCGPASEGWGDQGSPDGMPQDGVATTLATPEMLPVWKQMDGVLIAKLAVRVETSTRIPSKGGGDEKWGSKPKKSEVSKATKIIRRVW